jgi:hypothetical protein
MPHTVPAARPAKPTGAKHAPAGPAAVKASAPVATDLTAAADPTSSKAAAAKPRQQGKRRQQQQQEEEEEEEEEGRLHSCDGDGADGGSPGEEEVELLDDSDGCAPSSCSLARAVS